MPRTEERDDNYELRVKAADYVTHNKAQILARWEKSVRAKIEAAKDQNHLLLRNHLVQYLDNLLNLLRSPNLDEVKEAISDDRRFHVSANKSHGRLRATLPGYSVSAVIEEYNVLRSTITAALDEEGLLDQHVLEVVATVSEKAISHAASYFTNSIHTLRKKAVSMLMHDLRNPLNVISTTAALTKAKGDGSAGEMEIIRKNVEKMDLLITELLDAVRLEAGEGLELEFDFCDLRETLQVCMEAASLVYPDRVKSSLPGTPAMGMFDSAAVSRVIENLLSNAVKYGAPNTDITLRLEDEPDAYRMSVHNWGAPIDESEQETIFVTFARSHDPEKNYKRQGWGLGLAYAKAIAEGHGGSVEVSSDAESGTTFTIVLPKDTRDSNE